MWSTLKDYDLYPIYLLGLFWGLPNSPPASYLTLTIRSLKFDTYTTTLLTVPSSILFMLQCIFWTKISERLNEKSLIGAFGQVYNVVLLGILMSLDANASVWLRWAISSLVVGHVFVHAIVVAWTSRNAGSVRTRTVASAVYNMSCQVSGIIGANVYREDDKPLYHRGNRYLLGIAVMNIFLFLAVKLYYIKRNEWKKRKWTAMTPKEQGEYLQNSKHLGNKRLDFRFSH